MKENPPNFLSTHSLSEYVRYLMVSVQRCETENNHTEADNWKRYLAGITIKLQGAYDAVAPSQLEDSIVNVLDAFDDAHVDIIKFHTGWNYNLTFLEALSGMKEDFLEFAVNRGLRRLTADPLTMFADDVRAGLKMSEGNKNLKPEAGMTHQKTVMNHRFSINIDGHEMQIENPQDVKGFQNAIWMELMKAQGENLNWKLLYCGRKYK